MSKRIPFNLKFRPQIESGEYKVESRDGRPARIICWDMDSYNSIVALLANTKALNGKEQEYIIFCTKAGLVATGVETSEDLFIVTPEEELSEFEIRLLDWLSDDTSGEIPMERMKEVVRNRAAELLSLAREQFIKDGYIIEKKAFHDAVEKVDPGIMKEVSKNVDMTEYEKGRADALKDLEESGRVHCKSYDIGYDDGARDALKDLPRWKHNVSYCDKPFIYGTTQEDDSVIYRLEHKGRTIMLSDLEKLPGFKEDESHE